MKQLIKALFILFGASFLISCTESVEFEKNAGVASSPVQAEGDSTEGGQSVIDETTPVNETDGGGEEIVDDEEEDEDGDEEVVVDRDTTPPVVNFVQLPDPVTMNTNEIVLYEVIEEESGIESYYCILDGENVACPILGTIDLTDLSIGPHSIEVVVFDKEGNSGSDSYAWTVEGAPVCEPEIFAQPDYQYGKVDILFVVDTSGSLDSERNAMAEGVDRFVSELPEGTDYQIAVLFGHGDKTDFGGVLYQDDTEPVVLSGDMGVDAVRDALADKLAATPGDGDTDGGEAGIYSLHTLINGDKLADAKDAGFFRDDAALSVVFVADENDICARYPEGVERVYDGNKKELPAFDKYCVDPEVSDQTVYQELVALQNGLPLLIAGILYNDLATVPNGGENEYGYGYLDLIALNGGISVDLALPNGIEDGLSAIGELTGQKLQLLTDFELKAMPSDESEIVVTVDGEEVPFEFIEPMTVRLDIADAGQAMSEISIEYCQEGEMAAGSGENANP